MPDNVQTSSANQELPQLNPPAYLQTNFDWNIGSLDSPLHKDLQSQLPASGEEYAKDISYGDDITDIINNINKYQSSMEDIINNYPGGKYKPSTGTSFTTSFSDISNALRPETPSLAVINRPMVVGPESRYKRYASSKDFTTFGYVPSLGEEQEYKYGRAMTWGDTVGKAIGGGSRLAADTFIEGWKGWGRMFNALISWDSSKLMGSPEEQYEMAQKQEDIMNKYAIYDTAESKDGFFNRQLFGNMFQQAGFAIGAGLQFAAEEFLTAGFGKIFTGMASAAMLGRAIKSTIKMSEIINDTRKVMETVTASEKVTNAFATAARKIVPLYGTVDDIVKLHKAGAGVLQLTMTGLGGARRALSEFNMTRSESIFESAGTYKRMTDDLIQDYKDKNNGVAPEGESLEKIKQYAEDVAHDNFWTNVGVLSVMNRLQFDNMFKGFNTTRKIFNTEAANLEGKAFEVVGKIAGKEEKRAFQTGMFGRFSATGEIAKTFGKKTAAWEASKSIGKGLMKWEGLEGLQELIQNASDQGLRNYYTDLYHGAKGYNDKLDNVIEELYKERPWASTEGMKTFLMGALTGRLISPLSMIQERTIGRKEYKDKKAQAKEAVSNLNAFYSNPSNWLKESIANVKVQNKAAESMEEAAKNHNRYVFNNYKDSAFGKAVASAIKLNMFDSMRDTIKGYGETMSNEEFKQAFGIEATPQNKKNVKSFMGEIVSQMEDYHITYENLKDKYADRVLPELYKNNKPEDYSRMVIAKMAVDDAIETLTTNVHKSKQAVKRASALQTEIGSNKNIGSSSIEVLTKMGSEKATQDHINILEKEIADSEAEGVTLTPEARKILNDKKEELKLAKKWQQSYQDLLANIDESYSPTTEGRAYKAFADMVNLFNKRANNTTAISKEDVDDVFIKFNDYIRLNADHKSYVDAMNLLADPRNLKLLTQSGYSAILEIGKEFKKESKEEIKKAVGKENEVDEDDLLEISKESKVQKETTETELEKYLQEEYKKVKTAADAQGIDIIDYETWKQTAGVSIAKKFEENKKKAEQTKKQEPKKTEKPSVNNITIDGVRATIIKSTDIGNGKVSVEYQYDNPKEGDEGVIHTMTLDKKKGTFTDENGKVVQVYKATEKQIVEEEEEEQPEELTDAKADIESKKAFLQKEKQEAIDRIADIENNLLPRINNRLNNNLQPELSKLYEKLRNTKDKTLQKEINDEIDKLNKKVLTKNDIIDLTRQKESLEGQIESAKKFIEKKNAELAALEGEAEPTGKSTYKDFKVGDIINVVFKEDPTITGTPGTLTVVAVEKPDFIRFDMNFSDGTKDTAIGYSEKEFDELFTVGKKITIEPEYEAKDYEKLYRIAQAISQGKDVNTLENLQLISNYPKLLEQFLKIEKQRNEELGKYKSGDITAGQVKDINTKYDKLVKDLIDTYGKRVPKTADGTENDIPAYAQGLNRIKKAQMEADTLYANKEYQDGYKQLTPSNSLANTTDIVKVETVGGTVKYTRDRVNSNYVFDVATKDFPPGTIITYKVITDEADYDSMEPNRLTGEKYNKSKLFDATGKVKQEAYDDIPIGVYATIRGKETLIGTLHEPLWISYKINGKYPHIAAPEDVDIEEHVKEQVAENRKIRKTILDTFNENSTFVVTGIVSDKSNGILKMVNDAGLLKDRVNPKIGEGGLENRHGYFAIVRNGMLQTAVNIEATNVVPTETFTKNISNYSGVPVLMLPTPTGQFMPTFIGIPKIDKNQAEFIIEGWKAFKGITENPELVEAVYKAVGRELGGEPNINVLSEYLNQYYTTLDHKKEISPLGNGSDVEPGQGIFDIDAFGNIILQVKDDIETDANGKKTNKWFDIKIKTEKDIPTNITDLLQNLRTTVKFNDRRNDRLLGINSNKKITFLTMDNGKLISKNMTYNQYLLDKATTFVEKGTQSENSNKDWVYFANPVVKMTLSEITPEDNFDKEKEEVVVGNTFDSDIEDDFAALERMLIATNMTDDQVEEEAKKCNPNPFEDA